MLNLLKKISFKIINNVLGKEGNELFLQKKIFDKHIYCENVDNTK